MKRRPPLTKDPVAGTTIRIHHTSLETRKVYRAIRRRGIPRPGARKAIATLIANRHLAGNVDISFG